MRGFRYISSRLLWVLVCASTLMISAGATEGLASDDCVSRKEFHKLKRDMLILMGDFDYFSDAWTRDVIIKWQRREWKLFGTPRHQKAYMKRRYKNTVVMQRSGRNRLYDHNIFLRSLFRSRIHHKKYGDLGERFEGAVFIDIGSAILFGEGAPTVRDIHEDKWIEPHLSHLIATDINGRGCRYIDIYRRRRENLPFPVREVAMRLVSVEQYHRVTSGLLKEDTAIIFRSTNSGPDLYYTTYDIHRHFRGMIRAYYDRDVIYFFNKFILYKARNSTYFEKIGRDSGIGTSHRTARWIEINWKRRRLGNAFLPNYKFIWIRKRDKRMVVK